MKRGISKVLGLITAVMFVPIALFSILSILITLLRWKLEGLPQEGQKGFGNCFLSVPLFWVNKSIPSMISSESVWWIPHIVTDSLEFLPRERKYGPIALFFAFYHKGIWKKVNKEQCQKS